jgi:hypothetical protein
MYLPHAVIPLGLVAMAFVTLLRLLSGRWRDSQQGGSH